MSIIDNIRESIKDRRQDKLENDMNDIVAKKTNLNFNPYNISKILYLENDENFTERLIENHTWYTANLSALQEYYRHHKQIKSRYYRDDFNFFWSKVKPTHRKVHTKLPSLLTEKMVDLIIGNGYSLEASVVSFNENGEEIEEDNLRELLNQKLNNMEVENNFYDLLSSSISSESWSGGVAWKIVLDKEFSNYPIIQKADQRNFHLITKYGRVIGVSFKEYYLENKQNYIFYETYTTDENGDAMILSKLYIVDKNKQEREVPLTELKQTKDLEPELILKGLKGALGFSKKNKTTNKEFSNSPYGESDYAGLYSHFDALDEVASSMIDDIRKNKIKTYIPETFLPVDKYGNRTSLDEFENNFIQLKGHDPADEGSDKIEFSNPGSRIIEYMENWKIELMQVINGFGLSPLTIGATGLESLNASDASQIQREKVSLRTRKTKVNLWQEFLNKLVPQMINAYLYLNSDDKEEIGDLIEIAKNPDKYKIKVDFKFEEYLIRPIEERLASFSLARNPQNLSISLEEMVRQVYRGEKTEDEIREEIDRLKMELNLTIDDADRDLLE